jgi:CheY-like chemotaxis protein
VGRVLPASGDRDAYLALLEARLRALGAVAKGRGEWPRASRGERALARRVLRKLPGAWDDGDENLVRGFLDKWLGPVETPAVAAARSLLNAAAALAPIRARPGTLYFLLWEMESMLTSSGEIARIPAQSGVNRSGKRLLMAKRILVVDDDENILNLERTILEQKGFEVTGAGGGAEALKLLGERSFDLVLLDVMMPEVDGFTVCRKIKEDPRLKDIPVIFLTAKGGGEALAEGFESGAVMYINKPFTANKLLTIVNTMLESGTNLS